MGTVYLAQQQEPMERLVALKVVRANRASARLLARFEAERRALARLNHPNVAHVYDTGTADDGSPYIVMEHVPGEQITTFCESRKASIGERIEVFIDVCKGVQHVHHKGLIHRDLKPPNILVTDLDGTWTPKIIDFGIAKGMGTPLIDEDLTQGLLVGTPLYLAPEALKGETWDTRGDVYALGLVLYRLLIGVKPVPPEIAENMLGMIQSLARGEAIPTLTRRFSQLTPEHRDRVSRDRGVRTKTLESVFSRDLDWILARAIHLDPEARYATPMALAEDLRRHLDGDPVIARPPSLRYVGTKALKRHRWSVAALTTLFASMAFGTLSTAYQAQQARIQARVADDRRHDAEEVARILGEMITSANPILSSAGPTNRSVLDRVSKSLASHDLPRGVRANLLGQLRDAYQSLGAHPEAAALSIQVVEILDADDVSPMRRANALSKHARLLSLTGDDDGAVATARRGLEMMEAAGAERWHRGELYTTLSIVHRQRGEMDEALAAAKKDFAGERARPVVSPRSFVSSVQSLSDLERRRGNFDRAEQVIREGLAVVDQHPDGFLTANLLQPLAYVQSARGDHEGALKTFEEVLPIIETRMGPDHMLTHSVRLNIAIKQLTIGDQEVAEPIFRELSSADIHPDVRTTALMNLAYLELDNDDRDEALRLFQIVAADESGGAEPNERAAAQREVDELLSSRAN